MSNTLDKKGGEILKNIPALTKTEEKVMLFLWKQGKALSVQEMLETWDGEEKTWKDNYMRAIVHAMEEKGALEFSDLNQRGSRCSRRMRPAFSKADYYNQLRKRGGLTIGEMAKAEAVAMAKDDDREGMDALLRDLEEIIEEYRARDDE